jgi:hypothetical protein
MYQNTVFWHLRSAAPDSLVEMLPSSESASSGSALIGFTTANAQADQACCYGRQYPARENKGTLTQK